MKAVDVPNVVRAVDLLFAEGSSILEERRHRRECGESEEGKGVGNTGYGEEETASVEVGEKVPEERALDREHLMELHRILHTRFNKGEFQTLCVYVGVQYDDLPGEGLSDKARELVGHFRRRKKVAELVLMGRELRPDVSWPDVGGGRRGAEGVSGEIGSEGLEAVQVIRSRDDALGALVNEAVWGEFEAEVKRVLSVLGIWTKNYYLAREQYAKWGSALVPAIIAHNLAEAEDQIAAGMRELQSILSRVYDRAVIVPEVERAC